MMDNQEPNPKFKIQSEASRRENPKSSRRRRLDSPFEHIPFRHLRNPLPPLEIASAEQIEEIHEGSCQILENIGLEFQDEEALDIWQQAGAKVKRASRRVYLDRGLVLEAVAQAPAAFTWQARNPERNLFIGQNAINFAPQAGMAYAMDLDQGRRPGTLADYEKFLKLVHMCNALHFATTWVLEPQDVPVSLRHLKRLPTLARLTDKAAWGSGNGREISGDVINMARLIFGERMDEGVVIGTVINVSSPLRYDGRMLGGIITYARARQALIITPFVLAGAMSPITIASALAQQNAEALAGIALAQLITPGTPVLYGGFTTNIDMRSGSPAFGTPEGAWALLIGAQLARRYRLPYRGNGGLTTAKLPDAQAAYESMWNLWPAVLAHTNMLPHSAGWLDGGLSGSFEKFIIDVENLAMFHHFLAGPTLDRESLALDMLKVKYRLEDLRGEPCLIVRYNRLTPELLRELKVRIVTVSGCATDFEHYSEASLAGLRAVYREAAWPMFCFCGGMQLLAETYGAPIGALGPLAPSETDPYGGAYTPGMKQERGFMPVQLISDHPLFDGLGSTPTFYQSHYWEVKEAPPEFRVLAESDLCQIQAISHRDLPIIATQFHPEQFEEPHLDGQKLLENFFKLVG